MWNWNEFWHFEESIWLCLLYTKQVTSKWINWVQRFEENDFWIYFSFFVPTQSQWVSQSAASGTGVLLKVCQVNFTCASDLASLTSLSFSLISWMVRLVFTSVLNNQKGLFLSLYFFSSHAFILDPGSVDTPNKKLDVSLIHFASTNAIYY